jgi:hypothetical protein
LAGSLANGQNLGTADSIRSGFDTLNPVLLALASSLSSTLYGVTNGATSAVFSALGSQSLGSLLDPSEVLTLTAHIHTATAALGQFISALQNLSSGLQSNLANFNQMEMQAIRVAANMAGTSALMGVQPAYTLVNALSLTGATGLQQSVQALQSTIQQLDQTMATMTLSSNTHA